MNKIVQGNQNPESLWTVGNSNIPDTQSTHTQEKDRIRQSTDRQPERKKDEQTDRRTDGQTDEGRGY